MANLEITIKNGMFTEASGGNVKSFAPRRIVGMGWLVKINDDGTLEAISKEKSDEGEYSVKVFLKPGMFLETKRLTKSDGRYEKLGKKEHKIPGIDGVLGLSDGEVKDRYAYHVNKGLINFKKAFAIEKIVSDDPNTTYEAPMDTNIFTDGKCYKQILNNETCLLIVKEATWVIVESVAEDSEENKCRILYTQKTHNKLELPRVLSTSGRAEITRSLKKEFETVDDAFSYMRTLKLFKETIYELEYFSYDEFKVKATYYLDASGYLNVFLTRITSWNSRESLEKSGVDVETVIENKDYFSRADRFLEGKAYIE